jgi:hypothetical protein
MQLIGRRAARVVAASSVQMYLDKRAAAAGVCGCVCARTWWAKLGGRIALWVPGCSGCSGPYLDKLLIGGYRGDEKFHNVLR